MSTRTAAVPSESIGRSLNPSTALVGVLVAGLVLRMLFIGADGYRNDVSSFMSWTMTIASNPLPDFYAKAGFADYPPGYLLVLWVVGKIYLLLPHAPNDWGLLKYLVKLPACLFDLLDGWLIFAIVRRFASEAWATSAAALYVLNPASIYVSAYWGQVDSVPAGFMLAAVALVVYASDAKRLPAQTRWLVVCAWLAIAYAILIKPPSVMIALLMLAWPFATGDPGVRAKRAIDTALGIAAGLVFALLVALLFHPQIASAIPWLLERYSFGSAVYPYNSV
ncbi:MAG: hypothetical protein JO359_02245, partial [Candidatus Eremiobacteraeota bacterium]|nr:hypothetical protein [Candidatus Eremiobacteraeota bacterium]